MASALKRALGAVLTGILLISCGSLPEEPFYISPDLQQLVSYRRNLSSTSLRQLPFLWRSGRQALVLNATTDPQAFALRLRQEPMVMVTFGGGEPLAEELALREDKLFYLPAVGRDPGFALLPLHDMDELDVLAAKAHRTQTALPCGHVQIIQDLRVTNAVAPHLPVVLQEHLALPPVEELVKEIDGNRLTDTITELASLPDRHYQSANGQAVPALLKERIEKATAGKLVGLTITPTPLTQYTSPQNNLVITLPGTSDDATTVIVGAHMDTLPLGSDPADLRPGADDDASGIAVLIETLRILAQKQASFARRIEFHAYAAEEFGLRGSRDLAANYLNAGRSIAAMYQLDMVSYSAESGDQTIYLVATDTSSFLRRSLKNLMNTYLAGDYIEAELAHGTSDHKSWYDLGFPAVFPFENPNNYNPTIHTSADTLANAGNIDLAKRFVALTLAFVSHHAGLTSAASVHDSLAVSQPLDDDLKLAIVPSSSGSSTAWDIAVSSIRGIAKAEACLVTRGSKDFTCQGPLVALPLVSKSETRNFMINALEDSFSLEDGDTLAVFGYTEHDKIYLRRTVTLSKKT